MVAIKAHQAERFLAKLDPAIGAVLFYGPDTGLVSERARRLAGRLAEAEAGEPGEIVRIGEAELAEDPDRLMVELQTVPMFGGRKVVRLEAGPRLDVGMLIPLLEPGAIEARLIVEAGNLKPGHKLRKAFEAAKGALAVPCYADDARELSGLVDDVLQSAGLTITPAARAALVAQLGADRALSRGELEKLALYAMGKGRVDEDDVEAIVGDAAELALDRVVLAAMGGQARAALAECDRAVASGLSPQGVLAALGRHVARLHRMCADIEAGAGVEEVLRRARPPIHFKQKAAYTAQCRAWDTRRLGEAMRRVSEATRRARLAGDLETEIAERTLLLVAQLARRS